MRLCLIETNSRGILGGDWGDPSRIKYNVERKVDKFKKQVIDNLVGAFKKNQYLF